MKITFLLFGIFLLGACTTVEEATESVGYFDLELYNEKLVEGKNVAKLVTKTVKLDTEEEQQVIKSYDIGPELAMMNKYNINKPALAGKYEVREEANITTYTAKDEDLITRVLTIEKTGTEVVKIEIQGLQKSILSESKQSIVFEPEKYFRLISEDKLRFKKDLKKEVLIEY